MQEVPEQKKNEELQRSYQALRRKAFPTLQKLISSEYVVYKDLPKRAEKLLSAPVLEHDEKLQEFFDKQFAAVLQLVEIAKNRNEKLQAMEFFQKDFAKVLTPLDAFKDLQEEKKALEVDAKKVMLTRQELFQVPVDDIEKVIQERYEMQEALLQQLPEIVKNLKQKCKLLELSVHDAKKTTRFRLFEIFTGISPYKDLCETFEMLCEALNERLLALVDRFYAGKITCSEFSSACQQMAYDHDVVKLRNEISHRSSRLKDLRDAAYELYKESTNYRRFLDVIPGANQEKIYRDLLFFNRRLKETIRQIENPFEAFMGASNKDEINYVFRTFWMKIEELEPKLDLLKREIDGKIAFDSETIKIAFLKAVDDLEEVLQATTGKRPQLVAQLERDFIGLSKEKLFVALSQGIATVEERYPFARPFPFYMQMKNFAFRQKSLHEAKALQQTIEATRAFAKLMQYIKTFEEERIDVILEAFEGEFLLDEEANQEAEVEQTFSQHAAKLQHASELVVDEVLLETGLLDMKALQDVDQERLKKILKIAIGWAQRQLKKSEALPEMADVHAYLEYLCLLCHELFDAKVEAASLQNNAVAKAFQILSKFRKLVDQIESWLEQIRGAPSIAECHLLRHLIERSNTRDLQPLFTKLFDEIYKIREIAQAKAKGEDPVELQKWQQNFSEELRALEALKAKRQQELPFIYLPGYIRFFCP